MQVLIQWAIGSLCLFGCGSLVCRIHHMTVETRDGVFWQHVVLAAGFFAVPVVMFLARTQWNQSGSDLALLVVLVSMSVYLMLGASRWRHGAPEGTTKPPQLGKAAPRHRVLA